MYFFGEKKKLPVSTETITLDRFRPYHVCFFGARARCTKQLSAALVPLLELLPLFLFEEAHAAHVLTQLETEGFSWLITFERGKSVALRVCLA